MRAGTDSTIYARIARPVRGATFIENADSTICARIAPRQGRNICRYVGFIIYAHVRPVRGGMFGEAQYVWEIIRARRPVNGFIDISRT